MHQAFELIGKVGKTHCIWSTSARDAFTAGAKWASRHGGLTSVSIMAIHDPSRKDCWKLARRYPVDRTSNAILIATQQGAFLDAENALRY